MRPRKLEHHLAVAVEGQEIDGWTSATIESDLLTPADAFTLARGYDAQAYKLLRLDADILILIDGAPMMRGFVETRRGNWQGFTLTGKDRIGRMVAESAPLGLRYAGRDLVTVAGELAAPWFSRVVLSNAENRAVMRGRGQRVDGKPLLNPNTDPRRIVPGTSKWEALKELLERAGYLAWSSADGRDLVIARPDFAQPSVHSFHVKAAGSNCRAIDYTESNAHSYAVLVAMDGGRSAASKDANSADGTGANFLHPKRLVMPVEADSIAECQRLVDRERAERAAQAFVVEIQAWGWGRTGIDLVPALYAPDIVVSAYAENTPVNGSYYVTARSFSMSRTEESTRLRCVNLEVGL